MGWKSDALLCAGTTSNLTAGDFGASIPGGLRSEIVRAAVDDHSAADNVLHAETVCEKNRKGVAPVAEKGRQIPGVPGMGAVVRIVMASNIGKGVTLIAGAAGAGMNMKGKDRVAAGAILFR